MHFGIDSFRIGPVGIKWAFFIFFLAVVGFGAPILCLFYYSPCGGYEKELYREFQRIAAWDPKIEAQKAIQRGDFALYSIGDCTDVRDPGFGHSVDDDYARAYGRKWLGLCDKSHLTEDQRAVLEKALENLAVYNTLVRPEGLRRIAAKAK